MAHLRRAALLVFAVTVGPACADEAAAPAAEKERATLEDYARANPACREWSDGCAVCARQEDAAFACSLPGIACQPTALACRQPVPGQ